MKHQMRPRVVLLCHEDDQLDRLGLAAWLAASFALVGILVIRDKPGRRLRALRREFRRTGLKGALDVCGFRVFYRLAHAGRDSKWRAREVRRLQSVYPVDLSDIPTRVVTDPNTEESRRFLSDLHPDLMIARCKVLLNRSVFLIPRSGTFALHPGICPEYRNAHGCFWALVRRDLAHVGMTLLQIDSGVDSGPVYLRATYPFDEVHESHIVIQQRVVIENLNAVARTLMDVWKGDAKPISSTGRASAVWGHPRLTAYWKWKHAAKRGHRSAGHLPAVP